MFDKSFQLEFASRDTRPNPQSSSAATAKGSWTPGLKRAAVTDPAYAQGLEDLAERKHQRDLRAARRRALNFRKTFITLLE